MSFGYIITCLICILLSLFTMMIAIFINWTEEFRMMIPISILNFFLSVFAILQDSMREDIYISLISTLVMMGLGILSIMWILYVGQFVGIYFHKWHKALMIILFFICQAAVTVIAYPDFRYQMGLISHEQFFFDTTRMLQTYESYYRFYLYFNYFIVLHMLEYYLRRSKRRQEYMRTFWLAVGDILVAMGLYMSTTTPAGSKIYAVVTNVEFMLILLIICFRNGTYNTINVAGFRAFDRMSNGILLVNHFGNFLSANQIMRSIYPELNHAIVNETPLKDLVETFPDGEFEFEGHYYVVKETPLYSKELVVGRMYIFDETTIQHNAMEQMKRRRKQAEDEGEMKTRYLRQMGHEIRTPLNVIIGLSELSLQEPMDDEMRSRLLQMRRFSYNLMQQVNTLLDMVRISSGRASMKKQNYYIASLVNDMSNMTRVLLEGRAIDFQNSIQPDMADCLYGNADLIYSILTNLLGNSVKYTDKGRIRLLVGGYQLEDAYHLTLAVEDTGRGIPEADKQRIFAEFERIENEPNKAAGGYGLGLAMVKEMVRVLEGQLTVESQVDVGTTFTIDIPQEAVSFNRINLENDPAETSAKQNMGFSDFAKRYEYQGARLLIIDDLQVNLEIAREIFSRYGLEVATAQYLEDAQQKAVEKPLDMILVDYMMPGKSGLDILVDLRKQDGFQDIPVIVCSADADRGRRDEFMTMGFTDFLSKPLVGKEIERVLQTYLPKEKLVHKTKAQEKPLDFTHTNLLPIYVQEVEAMIPSIWEFVRQQDYSNLTTKVHGIKGASREIGMEQFASHAEQLEIRLRNGEFDQVEERVTDLLDELQAVLEEIHSRLKPGEDQEKSKNISQENLPPIPDDTWIKRLEDALGAYDYNLAMAILGEQSQWPDGIYGDQVEELRRLLNSLEYEKCQDMLQDKFVGRKP